MTKTTDLAVSGVAAIFFDLDDTLFDRRHSQRLALSKIVEDFPDLLGRISEETLLNAFLEADEESMREFSSGVSIGMSRLVRSRSFLAKLGLDGGFAADVTDSYLKHYPMLQTPVKGAAKLVNELAPRFPLGIISNGSPEVQYQKLERLGLKHLFRCIILSEEIGIRKPDPRIFAGAVAQLGGIAVQCLHVGDSYDADVVGAIAAGLKSCWFNPGAIKLKSGDVRPNVEIRHLSELTGLFGLAKC